MALVINKLKDDKATFSALVTPPDRLWLTRDGSRLVADGDPEAATLYCSGANRVPRAEYDALVKASTKEAAKSGRAVVTAAAKAFAEKMAKAGGASNEDVKAAKAAKAAKAKAAKAAKAAANKAAKAGKNKGA